MSAELDTEAPSSRGIGRITDGDPPPRLGAKYGAQLQRTDTAAILGPAMERTILGGFASRAALFDSHGTAKPEDEVWALWVRHLAAAYNEANEMLARVQREEMSPEGLTAVYTMLLCDRGTGPLVEEFERLGILKGGLLRRLRSPRPMTYVSLLIGAGTALFHVLSEQLDESFGSGIPLALLEEYEQPRSLRDATSG